MGKQKEKRGDSKNVMEQINTVFMSVQVYYSSYKEINNSLLYNWHFEKRWKLTKTKAQKLLNELLGGMSWSLISLHEPGKWTKVSGRRDVFLLQLNFLILFEI